MNPELIVRISSILISAKVVAAAELVTWKPTLSLFAFMAKQIGAKKKDEATADILRSIRERCAW